MTRHGKPAAVIVAADEFERLQNLMRLQVSNFAVMLLDIPKGDVQFKRIQEKSRRLGL